MNNEKPVRLNKAAFYKALGTWPEGHEVTLWALPKGALCRLTTWDGINILENGSSSICRSEIVDLLADHGIAGEILIDSAENINPTISRWIRWFMSEKTVANLPACMPNVTITTLGNCNIKDGLPFTTNSIMPMKVKAAEVPSIARRMSENNSNLHTFMIDTPDGERYYYEPERLVQGIIASYTDAGYIVAVNNGETMQLVNRVSLKVRNYLNLANVPARDVVGMHVTLQYTSYMGKDRLRPYKSAMVTDIPALRRLVDMPYYPAENLTLDYLFDLQRPLLNSVITPTRLASCNTGINSDGDVCFNDEITGETIAWLKRGHVEGSLGVIAKEGEQVIYYTFTTIYDADGLRLPSFHTVIGRKLWECHGIQLCDVGVYYVLSGVDMLGKKPINSKLPNPIIALVNNDVYDPSHTN